MYRIWPFSDGAVKYLVEGGKKFLQWGRLSLSMLLIEGQVSANNLYMPSQDNIG